MTLLFMLKMFHLSWRQIVKITKQLSNLASNIYNVKLVGQKQRGPPPTPFSATFKVA